MSNPLSENTIRPDAPSGPPKKVVYTTYAERKIIQISYVSSRIIVLCNDGSLYYYEALAWHKLPEIPQD